MKATFIVLLVMLLLPVVHAKNLSQAELELAFAKDGYEVVKTVEFQGKKGLLALHKTAVNYETKRRKQAIYVEGSGYQMGYLISLLAYSDVDRMANDFVDNIVFDFINADIDPKKIPIIWGILKQIIIDGCQAIVQDIPQVYIDEMKGLVDGAKAVDPKSKVRFDHLLALNVGFDALLSTFYAVNQVWDRYPELKPEYLNIPVMCNAFSVFGKATKDGKHYFGRDFMFPTASIFEHTACMIIYNPDDERLPLVSQAAPGFVGSVAAMNLNGIGMGVDMSPAGNCDWERPGLNSLMMVRHATHSGKSAQSALDVVIETQRGVSWDYMIADGTNDRSVAIEGGHKTTDLNPLKYPPEELQLLELVPSKEFLERYENQQHQKGLMVRWNDYVYPQEFLQFNQGLFEYHEKKVDASKAWGERGYINPTMFDHNCPQSFYFAPQRENREDVLIVINHFVCPTMRLCGMNPMTVEVMGPHKADDIQWRYDELNNRILSNYGEITQAKAIELIDFLNPTGQFPEYYAGKKNSSDGKTKVIGGSLSLCNLTERVMFSQFGYYADEWVTVTLPNFCK